MVTRVAVSQTAADSKACASGTTVRLSHKLEKLEAT